MTPLPAPGGPLEAVTTWGFQAAAAWAVKDSTGSPSVQELIGPVDQEFPWASVTKVLTAIAVWVAIEEGTVSWEDPVGPAGSTLRHLLAHASGLAPDDDTVLAPAGTRRIYSNRGIEVAADHLAEASGMPFPTYLSDAVLEPLNLTTTRIEGSPAHGARGTLRDLLAVAVELLCPRLVDPATLAGATSVAFPGLAGVLPGFGSQPDNDWGLGVEIRNHKQPHWTGERNSPATFGHFGRSGSLLWVDPIAGRALVSLSARPFGPWAAAAWPLLSDAVLSSSPQPS